MIELSLAGLSQDGARLLLVTADGTDYSLPITDILRAALRGDPARIGQLEIQMESALRPRDIQARIRAGESPESVAAAAQSTVEAILPYARPVLAERAHVADRALRASLRRSTETLPSGARTLGAAVAGHLGPLHVDPETVEWDAWRREDGRWMLTATYSTRDASGPQAGVARFAFDTPGNFVTVENDEARWLVGEAATDDAITPDVATYSIPRDLDEARRKRSTGVSVEDFENESPPEQLPLGDDAIGMVSGESFEQTSTDPDDSTIDLTETADRIRASDTDPPRREITKSRGRASVPSWDEIMFGGKGE
jgi:Protein of unknown function (DUF3071)